MLFIRHLTPFRRSGLGVLVLVLALWIAGPAESAAQSTTSVTAFNTVAFADDGDGNVYGDVNGDGIANPGDTLRYTIDVCNPDDERNVVARGILFTSPTPADTLLVVGSVTTSDGSVTIGNNDGDTSVAVNIGNISDNNCVTVTFDVVVGNPLAAGVTQVSCQGDVMGMNVPSIVTDDPNTPAPGDPTVLPVEGAPSITATKDDSLAVDANGDGVVNPGETVQYTVLISNVGNQGTTGIAFTSGTDPNATLVAGSVTTTQGNVTIGNSAGDTTVAVAIGTVPGGGGGVTLTFRVVVRSPLPAGVTQIACQGTVTGVGFAPVPTDDPATPAPADPTITPIVAGTPLISATKDDSLAIDVNGNGAANPGDTVRYTVLIANTGNAGANGLVFTSGTDPNSRLVAGSVTTTQGTVTAGNTAGATSVAVNVGAVPAGGVVTVTFLVVVDNPLPVGITQIACQGTVTGNGIPATLTDDPATPAPADPTITPVAGAAVITATKDDSLAVDVNGDGVANPGDTVRYTVILANNGNQGVTGIVFNSGTDPNSSLVAGSVTTTQGAVTAGNNAGDTTVAVNVGAMAGGGGSVTITFQVVIDNPLPAGITQIACQGTVTGNGIPATLTDDPATPAPADPTITPVVGAALITATKDDALFVDVNGDGVANPGETVRYTVVLANNGNQGVTGIVFNSGTDPNSRLVAGSVTTTQGAVTTGNNAGDATVAVNVGAMAGGGGSVTITFQVVIHNPLPIGISQIACQGTVTGNGIAPVLTDDPATPAPADPTITPVVIVTAGLPLITATLDDALFVDVNGDGVANPGDTVRYTAIVANNGDQGATGIVFTSGTDPNSALVAGSVTTTQGTVTAGNAAGDSTVAVNVGPMAGGGDSVTITFQVVVDNPLPAGINQIACQGTVAGTDITPVLTDDPATPAPADPTITPVVTVAAGLPRITATLDDALFVDVNHDGLVNPGETVRYTAVLTNLGDADATNVVFTSGTDSNSRLVAGSVTTTQGTVTLGNLGGQITVAVDVGTLGAGGGSVTVRFQVVVDAPLPAGVNQIVCQGTVTGSGLTPVPTDDPATPAPADPTITPIVVTGTPPSLPADIPTLGEWGLILLASLLGALGAAKLRRRAT